MYRRRALGSFIDECVAAVPATHRSDYTLWVRSDSAGYTEDVVAACERHHAWFTVTAKRYDKVNAAIYGLAVDPAAGWRRAKGVERWRGSEVADHGDVLRQAVPAGGAPPARRR